MQVTIAVDAMGGDHGPPVTVAASLQFLELALDTRIVLVGNEAAIRKCLAGSESAARDRVSIQPASEVVEMDEAPADALRRKKDSSMRVAINMVKEGEAHACVSRRQHRRVDGDLALRAENPAGHRPPGDRVLAADRQGRRPACWTWAPTSIAKPSTCCSSRSWAVPSVAAVEARAAQRRPAQYRQEDIKGNEVVKQAAELLRDSDLNFHGNVEGNDIFKGTTDVVVCDGFVGNVALKTTEGLAQMLGGFLREEFSRKIFTRFAALVAMPVINAFKRRVDPRRYNGASLLGLKGIVVKSHGSADDFAFLCAHRTARAEEARGRRIVATHQRACRKMASRAPKRRAKEQR